MLTNGKTRAASYAFYQALPTALARLFRELSLIQKLTSWSSFSGSGGLVGFPHAMLPGLQEIAQAALRLEHLAPDAGHAVQVVGLGQVGLFALHQEPGDGSGVAQVDGQLQVRGREEGMLASARGVAIKSKAEAPKGNMLVISAAQGNETAYPYREKRHGLFTYFLLKKLQETKGNTTFGELFDYVRTQVAQKSIVVNEKSQTPSVNASGELTSTWKQSKLF